MSHWVDVILEEAFDSERTLPPYVTNGLQRLTQIVRNSDCHHFRTDEFEELADELSVCDNLPELSQLLWQIATSSGFQHFSLFLVNQGRSPNHATRMCTSYSQEWLSQYEARSYQYIDPVFNAARELEGYFSFSEISKRSPMANKFWKDAESYGIGRNGFCFVTTRPDGSRFAVTFSSCGNEAIVDKQLRLGCHDLTILSQLAIECFCFTSHGDVPTNSVLSNEELRFLHTLATDGNPEKALTQMAVFGGNNAIQSSIRKKLNVETVFQAVAVASSLQWFDDLPFCAGEVVTPFPKLAGWDAAATLEAITNDQ